MATYTEYTKNNTDPHQKRPAQNPTPEVDRQLVSNTTLWKMTDQLPTVAFLGRWPMLPASKKA